MSLLQTYVYKFYITRLQTRSPSADSKRGEASSQNFPGRSPFFNISSLRIHIASCALLNFVIIALLSILFRRFCLIWGCLFPRLRSCLLGTMDVASTAMLAFVQRLYPISPFAVSYVSRYLIFYRIYERSVPTKRSQECCFRSLWYYISLSIETRTSSLLRCVGISKLSSINVLFTLCTVKVFVSPHDI